MAKRRIVIVPNRKDLLQVNQPIKKSTVFVYRNPDNIYLSSLKDVDVQDRKNDETIIYNTSSKKWESGPISNVDIQIDLDVIDAGEY